MLKLNDTVLGNNLYDMESESISDYFLAEESPKRQGGGRDITLAHFTEG